MIKAVNIYGSWSRTETNLGKTGITVDTFEPDGTKLSILTLFSGKNDDFVTLKFKTQWQIKGNRLIEVVEEVIEDKAHLMTAFKVGDQVVSKIKKLEPNKLVLLSKENNQQYSYRRKT